MNVFRMEDYNGLVIYKEWKRILGLANVEHSKLVVVSQEKDMGQY